MPLLSNPGAMPVTEDDVEPYTPMPKSAGMERRLDHKLFDLERQMKDVERRRNELNRLLIESENRYKPLRRDATSEQMRAHQAAQRASQNRIAALEAELDLKTTDIQNRLDETLAQLDNYYDYQQARLEAERRLKTTQHKIKARTESARLSAQADMELANEQEPAFYEGVSYSDIGTLGSESGPVEEEKDEEVEEARPATSNDGGQVTSRPASPPGGTRPDFPRQLAPAHADPDNVMVLDGQDRRIKYDAVLVYHDKETRDIWTNYLRAYGEKDLFESRNLDQGEYYIYLGTFDSPERAQKRLSTIEETIGSTVNSRIATRDLSPS